MPFTLDQPAAPIEASAGSGTFTLDRGDYVKTLGKTWDKNINDLSRDLDELLGAPTVLGKVWGGVKAVGGAFAIPYTPIEAGITEYVGKPVEQATGVKAETVGELGSLASMFIFDPIGAAGAGARALGGTRTARAIGEALSPGTVSAEAEGMARILTHMETEKATTAFRDREHAKGATWFQSAQGMLNRLPFAERFTNPQLQEGNGFLGRYEAGLPQPEPWMQAAADVLRQMQDRRSGEIRQLLTDMGRNPDDTVHITNYLKHLWRDGDIDQQLAELTSKSPMEGSKGFLRQRTHPTLWHGMQDGLRPLSEDPIQYILDGFFEQDKWIYANRVGIPQMKEEGLIRWKPYHERLGPDEVRLDDPAFRKFLPPTTISTPAIDRAIEIVYEHGYDPDLRKGLDDVANAMGVTTRRPLRRDVPGRSPGLANPTTGEAFVAFGMDDTTYEHEIGHHLDWALRLSDRMHAAGSRVWEELGELAMYRNSAGQRALDRSDPSFISLRDMFYPYASGMESTWFVQYLLSKEERIANLFHGYWYSPDLVKQVAPNAYRVLEDILKPNTMYPGTQIELIKEAVRNVKPSLRLALEHLTEDVKFTVPGTSTFVPGWRHMGDWVAHRDAARVLHNYLRPGLRGNSLYDAMRSAGNSLNMLQLGLSAFHFTFTSVDTIISEVGRGIESAIRGEFGRAAMSIIGAPAAPVRTIARGHRLRRALLDPASMTPELRPVVSAWMLSGMRPQMDAMWRAVEQGMWGSIRDGTFTRDLERAYERSPVGAYLKLPFNIAGRVLQDTSSWLMDGVVPRQKIGVWMNLAEDWLRRNPNATMQQTQQAMQLIQQSVDNRLGQMVYDNLFFNRTFKDLLFIAVRSVGWNLGTIRELGGGVIDAARYLHGLTRGEQIEFTHRMAYTIAMPVTTAAFGASLTYLYTGKGPQVMADYFFPPTGQLTPRGDKERVIIPSYMKDVFEYNNEPVRTLFSKLHPLLETINEIYNNRDFYGGLIVDPQGDFAKHLNDMRLYIQAQFLPFSVRSARRLGREGSPAAQQVGSFLGLQAAPAWITAPERGAAWQRRADILALRRRLREEAQGLR